MTDTQRPKLHNFIFEYPANFMLTTFNVASLYDNTGSGPPRT